MRRPASPEVEIRPVLPEWPERPVAVRVSGPSAGVAHQPEPGDAWVRVLLLPLLLGMGLYLLRSAVGQVREAGREARADVAPEVDRAAAVPQAAVVRPDAVAWKAPPRQRLPRNRVVPVLLAWYVLLVLAVVGLIWSLVAWNRSQDALLSATVTTEVVATHLGRDNRIEVAWTGADGDGALRLTPRDPDQFALGDQVLLRYDPDRTEAYFPADPDAFEGEPRDRNMWTALLLSPGVLLVWAWTWRLGRWLSGLARRGNPVAVAVLVATARYGGGEPAAFWLRVRERDGSVRYQRALWNRQLVAFARRELTAPAPVPNAVARRCLGLRRMLLVDLPGVGRLWPASTARRRPPRNYDLDAFDPAKLGWVLRGGWGGRLAGVTALAVLAAILWALAGPVAAGYLLVLLVSFWLWHGATPWHGLYAYVAEPDEPEPEPPAMANNNERSS